MRHPSPAARPPAPGAAEADSPRQPFPPLFTAHAPGPKRATGKAGRTHHRRQEWEDESDPLVSWPAPTPVPPGPDKVAVMAARHANREKLWDDNDAAGDPVTLEEGVARVMQNWASGIERTSSKAIAHLHPWRARPWDGDEGTHCHIGYYRTWEEALLAVRLWHAACGTTDDESLNCAKWSLSPWWMRRAVTMTMKQIEDAAREDVAKPGRGAVRMYGKKSVREDLPF